MRFGGFRHSVFALLYLLVVVVFGTASADAVAKSSGDTRAIHQGRDY